MRNWRSTCRCVTPSGLRRSDRRAPACDPYDLPVFKLRCRRIARALPAVCHTDGRGPFISFAAPAVCTAVLSAQSFNGENAGCCPPPLFAPEPRFHSSHALLA
jgi:hypothetical protein